MADHPADHSTSTPMWSRKLNKCRRRREHTSAATFCRPPEELFHLGGELNCQGPFPFPSSIALRTLPLCINKMLQSSDSASRFQRLFRPGRDIHLLPTPTWLTCPVAGAAVTWAPLRTSASSLRSSFGVCWGLAEGSNLLQHVHRGKTSIVASVAATTGFLLLALLHHSHAYRSVMLKGIHKRIAILIA
jgi:hypothetical protein